MAFPYYGPQRTSNQIMLYLSPKQPAPEAPPLELQGYISKDVWNMRIPAITRLASRYFKPTLERIWMIIALIAIVVLPIAVYPIVLHTTPRENDGFNDGFDDRFDDRFDDHAYFLARAVSFGVFVGSLLLFYVPMGIWKYVGHKRVNRMVQGWMKEDQNTSGGASVPSWRVRTPGVWNSRISLAITIPLDRPPTTFHPDAYLPSYINGPMDADAPAFRGPMGPSGYGYQNSYGNVPLYGNEKAGYGYPAAAPPAHGQGDNPFGDEKAASKGGSTPFEDVKV
ncbi:hypothetical protein PLICRDRAFT_37349 [Plicaturopsis crispa FD-325 SS-3]|nr:hypothetical protein PLICRDRAFT_37349 [Plicaturopsis crispa FD-325 SS-3]